MPLSVGELKFGEIDAKNEVFQQTRYGSEVFSKSFQIPPRVNLDELLLGSRFFISGQKGCGKTALLLHTRKTLADMGFSTHTILFKSGISETERQQLANGKGFEVVQTSNGFKVQYDYTVNWLWFIYKNLLRLLNPDMAYKGQELARDLRKIFGVDDEVKVSTFADLALSKLKLNAKAALKVPIASAEISADLEAAKKDDEERIAIEIIQICERYLGKILLKPEFRCCLFFDELEIFWSRLDQKERDLFLIRDLLQAVARVNRNLGEHSASFVVYASVRSEVLEEVNRVGPEIARDVSDFGVVVNWNVRANAERQPILEIVQAKIQASEEEAGAEVSENSWDRYFPEQIHGRNVEDHLLDIAMFKPRHIVSRLNLAKSYDPDAEYISAEALEETSTEFSSTVWREVEEELLVTYSAKQVSNLKALLTGYKSKISVVGFEQRVLQLGRIDPSLSEGFKTRKDVINAFKALYRVGAVGNRFLTKDGKTEMRDRWVFRDYGEPVLDEIFVVHESLRKVFQLSFAD
jgi:hypothetical protein